MLSDLGRELPPSAASQETDASSSSDLDSADSLQLVHRCHKDALASLRASHRQQLLLHRLALALLLLLLLLSLPSPPPPPPPPPPLSRASPSRHLVPSLSTRLCQQRVHAESTGAAPPHTARPLRFTPADAKRHRVFRGVAFVRLPAGVATDAWPCGGAACAEARGGGRGFAYLWVPARAARNATRLLYLHGGSWYTGSPEEMSYAPFCAKLAALTGLPLLAVDYPLLPHGTVDSVLPQVGRAARWLATHEPLDVLADPSLARPSAPRDAPPLVVMGDSSGGGSAASALLAQASDAGLPRAGGARLSAAVLFSPWLNLACDTPSYSSQAFCAVQEESGGAPSLHLTGDVAFPLTPARNSAEFLLNGKEYAGSRSVYDPLANPLYAPRGVLARLPPVQIHTGMPEVLSAEAAIFATNLAAAGGSAELHLYDGMWHVFPQYFDGCGEEDNESLLFASVALNRTAAFLSAVRKFGGAHPTPNGVPRTMLHYEYPQGFDTTTVLT
ncbi:hypothetical protein AB1Y20_011527 [Prymnesium parvum]|uniref:Alpha/beta hydrolase fold-3 domain-containing protein n=1 Tax=Prymnesium parvum TaxID=97485 RepID=A0AB34IIU7_PRYPA